MRGASTTADIVADYRADEAGPRIRVGTASPGILSERRRWLDLVRHTDLGYGRTVRDWPTCALIPALLVIVSVTG